MNIAATPKAATPKVTPPHSGHGSPPPSHGGGGHAGHHDPGKVFPGQPPAWVLPPSVGPGVTQPPDVPDTAKGSPLPHWDGVLLGSAMTQAEGGVKATNLYVNGAFNYMDHTGSVETAFDAIKKLTAGPERPAAVLWRDKFGIIHAQALLQFGGANIGADGVKPFNVPAPTAAHLTKEGLLGVNLGHPEALAIVDGDLVFGTAVGGVAPVKENGAGWPAPAQA